ncbi:hypothetical protein HANVADRAFT_120462 [Hanseniaspora valbyensis NRRL Y-1626]|uniref:Uncharacterized protein n=1 Tax=Hanseniaspora valbyensis NRRL Y-1626 TaxID=766949 RepID=A0A1B7TBB6_9ASCO|nr:hypothetical protein HANVADRAFT_120462 [Hanseniaspora valbyensis NRRL Y-1626]
MFCIFTNKKLFINTYKNGNSSNLLLHNQTKTYIPQLNRITTKKLLSTSSLNISKFSILKLRLIQNLKIISVILSGIVLYDTYDLFANKNDINIPIAIVKNDNNKKNLNNRDLIFNDLLENDINLYYLDNLVVNKKINNLIRKHLFIHPDEHLTLTRPVLLESTKIGPVDQRFHSLKINIPSENNKRINWFEQIYFPVKYLTISYSKKNPEETDDKYKLKMATNVKLKLNPVNLLMKFIDSFKNGSENSSSQPEKETMYMTNGDKENSDTDGGLHFTQKNSSIKKEYALFIEDKLYINNDPNKQISYSCTITNDLQIKINYLKYSHRDFEKNNGKWESEVIINS